MVYRYLHYSLYKSNTTFIGYLKSYWLKDTHQEAAHNLSLFAMRDTLFMNQIGMQQPSKGAAKVLKLASQLKFRGPHII